MDMLRQGSFCHRGDPDRIETLNDTLNDLAALGFDRLVQNFCTQPDPERASDFLFEIWICQMLRRNQDVQDLEYEPPEIQNPPDFRFIIHGVSFDMQVKRLHNVTYELTKLLFNGNVKGTFQSLRSRGLSISGFLTGLRDRI